ncbi:aminoacyl-tRNA hydrolase [Patescibacteria group bacterium]
MKIIVGLGNPDKKYQNTRHNIGFKFIDKLADIREISPIDKKNHFSENKRLSSKIIGAKTNGEKIILVKPQTYMNMSGLAVKKILNYYKAKNNDLIIVSDDIDIPIGNSRIRLSGSSGGHRGIQDIIESLNSNDFIRIKIGINTIDNKVNPKNQIDTISFVMQQFQKNELKIINKVIDMTIAFLVPFLGSKKTITSHTIHSL